MNIDPKYLMLLLKLRKIASPRDYADLVKSLFSNAPEDVKRRVYAMVDAALRDDLDKVEKIREVGVSLGLSGDDLDRFVEYIESIKEYLKTGVKYISTNEEI